MEFTYRAYRNLLNKIKDCGYYFAFYNNWINVTRSIILRHDIDYDVKKSVRLAEIENSEGVVSTYFVLVTSDFYNVFSKESYDGLMKILDYGHNIGLHFDEDRCPDCKGDAARVVDHIFYEAELLEQCIARKVSVVSMHRPSRALLEADVQIPRMINSGC